MTHNGRRPTGQMTLPRYPELCYPLLNGFRPANKASGLSYTILQPNVFTPKHAGGGTDV
jgi:hypothetical protein